MDIEQNKWYDLPCLAEPINGAQLSALLDMVNHEGWPVYIKLKNIDARSSAVIALTPASPPEDQTAHRALWYALSQDLEFATTLKSEAANVEGVDHDDLDFRGGAISSAPIPSVSEYDNFNKQMDKSHATPSKNKEDICPNKKPLSWITSLMTPKQAKSNR